MNKIFKLFICITFLACLCGCSSGHSASTNKTAIGASVSVGEVDLTIEECSVFTVFSCKQNVIYGSDNRVKTYSIEWQAPSGNKGVAVGATVKNNGNSNFAFNYEKLDAWIKVGEIYYPCEFYSIDKTGKDPEKTVKNYLTPGETTFLFIFTTEVPAENAKNLENCSLVLFDTFTEFDSNSKPDHEPIATFVFKGDEINTMNTYSIKLGADVIDASEAKSIAQKALEANNYTSLTTQNLQSVNIGNVSCMDNGYGMYVVTISGNYKYKDSNAHWHTTDFTAKYNVGADGKITDSKIERK